MHRPYSRGPDLGAASFARVSGTLARACAAFLLCAAAGEQTTVKLNGPITTPPEVVGSAVDAQLTPDGRRIVYLAYQESYLVAELYSMPLDGSSAPVQLSGPLAVGRGITDFEIAPDGSRVVYRADQGEADVLQLYSAPIDGGDGGDGGDDSVPWVLISGALVPDGYPAYVISADGRAAVFLAGNELWSTPLDGSEPPSRLAAADPSDGQVFWYEIDPASRRVVFTADLEGGGFRELYSVPLGWYRAGSGQTRQAPSPRPTRLNTPRVLNADVTRFHIAGQRVIYQSAQEHFGRDELFSVPIDGSAPPRRISGFLVNGGEVYWVPFQVSPDASRAVYLADQDVDELLELYSVPVDGSSYPVQLNAPLVAGGDVQSFGIAPDSRTVVYRADQETDGELELYAAPLDGSSGAFKLSSPLVQDPIETIQSFRFSPDGRRVVYLTERDDHEHFELRSVELRPGGLNTRLNGRPPPTNPHGEEEEEDYLEYRISPDGRWVVYLTDEDRDDVFELFSVPIDGGEDAKSRARHFSAGPIKLNRPLPRYGHVGQYFEWRFQFDIGRAGQVVYIAEQERYGYHELYRVPVDGSAEAVMLHPPLALGPRPGGVAAFRVSSDGSRVVYKADQETNDVYELYGAPLRPGGRAVKLSAPGQGMARDDNFDFQIARDGARVAYLAEGDLAPRALFSARIDGGDGGSGPIQLSSPLVQGEVEAFQLSPDGTRAVYAAREFGIQELYGVPTDGSAVAVKLNAPLVSGGDVSFCLAQGQPHSLFTPDGSRVLYRADQEVDERFEIYSVRADGSAPPVKLNGALVAGGDVVYGASCFLISADGTRAVYLADQDVDGVVELYSARVDGTGTPFKLNAALVPGGAVYRVELTPDGTRAVYLADQDTDNVNELYSTRIDGSTAPTKLNPPLPSGREVYPGYRISADGARVVYVADQLQNGRLELFSVPTDGSQPAVRLNAGMPTNRDVRYDGFAISPDSSRVVYLADPREYQANEFLSAPIDGSSPPLLLEAPSAPNGNNVRFAIDPLSRWVVYNDHSGWDLYRVSLLGSSPPLQLNGPTGSILPLGAGFQISPDGRAVLYVSDEDEAGVYELYATLQIPWSAQTGTPERP